MGGSKGKRTKGNVKPSSSGRSAELLSAAGVTGFIGFSGIATDLPGYVVPSGKQTENDEIEATVDNDFKLVLKKATKRDTVTKVKALQEFSQLIETKDDAAIKGVLPFWPRLYSKLAIDHDRRVRESTHQTQKILIGRVKKNIAPYLKSLMGTWVVSMCDLYAPAASASKQAFQIAFPAAKQPEALEFCKEEIFSYIEDVLYRQTAATLSDPKLCDPEEMESKYIRLIAGCFNGLTMFLTIQNSKTNENLFNRILTDPKYWKYAKNKDPEIRRAWFALVAALCEYYPDILRDNYASKVCSLVLGQLGEENPVVIPVVWDAILHITTTVDNCWDHVNIGSAFLPQMWKILDEGGRGCAGCTFQNLLPLLSKLPASVTEPRIHFYKRFYGCLRSGMLFDKTQSVSEVKAIIKAYFECLRYSLLQHMSYSEEDEACRTHLVNIELINLVKESITSEENKSAASLGFLYDDLAECIQTLNNQALKDTSLQSIVLTETLQTFSSEIFQMVEDTLNDNSSSTDQDRAVARLSLFFRSMFCGPKKTKASKVSVRFAPEEIKEKDNGKEMSKQRCDILASESLKVCHVVFCKLQESPRISFLRLFSETIKITPSIQLCTELLALKNDEYGQLKNLYDKSPVVFTKNILFPWLLCKKELFVNEEESLKCILSIILSLCSCISEKEGLLLLEDLGKACDPLTLDRLIVEAAALRDKEPRLKKWLKGDFVGNVVTELAKNLSGQLLQNENPKNTLASSELLHICFTANKNFDPLISAQHMNSILDSFTQTLTNLLPLCITQEVKMSEMIVNLVCDLAVNLFKSCQGCLLLPAVESLLLSIFKLNCYIFDREASIASTLQETWAFGTTKLVELQGLELEDESFVYQCAAVLNKILREHDFKYGNNDDLSVLSDKVCCLVEACLLGLKERDELNYAVAQKMMNEILFLILPKHRDWVKAEEDFLSECTFMRAYVLPESTLLPWVCYDLKDLQKGVKKFLLFSKITLDVFQNLLNGNVEAMMSDLPDKPTNEVKNYVTPQVLYHLKHLITAVGFVEDSFIMTRVPTNHQIRKMYSLIPSSTATLVLKTLTYAETESALNEISLRALAGFFPHTKALSVMLDLAMKKSYDCQKWCESFIRENHLVKLVGEGHYEVLYKLYSVLPFIGASSIAELITLATNHVISDEKVAQGKESCCMDVLSMCFNSQRPDVYIMESVQEDLGTLLVFFFNLRKSKPDVFNPEWDGYEIWFVNHICSIFYATIKHFPQLLSHDYWDMILCSTVSWLEKCRKAALTSLFEEPNMAAILTFQLLCLIEETLQRMAATQNRAEFIPALLIEWNELYLENIFNQVLPLFLDSLLDRLPKLKDTPRMKKLLTAIGHSLENLPSELILKCVGESAKFEESAADNLPKEISYLLERLYRLLMSGSRPIVLGSHAIIISVIDKIPQMLLPEEQPETEEEKSRSPPKQLVSTTQHTEQVVEVMLQNFQVGDCCLVQPQTDTFTFTYVYFLSWIQMLTLFGASNSELRSEYAVFLDKSKLLEGLLLNLFRIMPSSPSLSPESQKCHSPGSMPTMFTELSNIYYNEWSTFSELQHLACQVYLLTLEQLPALVRQWWLNQDKRTSEIVNKYTASYVSSCISLQEIKAVQDTETKFTNMTVKGRPVAREVVARYTMEEITFELIIRLPPNHPLGPVAIETGQRIGVGNTQWRNWMLQLTTFLTHQNGSILDGLSLWKRNVDKRFEGIEECMICFYVLHGATCQLPRLTCRTCKKRFHPACLYKWFNTSQNSSCPLCRNLF